MCRPAGQESALVPKENAELIARRFGVAGERFLRELSVRLAGIAGRWRLRLGEPLSIGIGGYLVIARRAEGSDAVLKLSPTGDGQDRANELEAWALKRWAGEGAVRLFAFVPGGRSAAARAVRAGREHRHAS